MLAAGLTDVNFALSFWTVITFALLLVVLGKFAWRPILTMIEQREKTIAESLESAKRAQLEAEKASAETKASLERARSESADQLRRAQAEVAAAKTELMAAARKESDELLSAARKTIQEEKRQAIAEIRAQAVDLAIQAASKLIQTQMDPQKQKQLVEDYLKSLPRS